MTTKEPKVTAIIPAQPGWFEIGFCRGAETFSGIDIWKDPIVAWKILDDGWAMPILAADIAGDESLLLSPDGQVIDPMVASWDSLEDFINSKSKDSAEK